MVSRAKIGISLHSSSIFQTLVLGVTNYLVIALEPPSTLRYESSNYAHRPSLSSLQPSRQNSFSQDNPPSSVPAPKQVHRFSWTRFIGLVTLLALLIGFVSFLSKLVTPQVVTAISILGSFLLLRFVVKVILQITFTLLRYLFWFAVLCAILLCVLDKHSLLSIKSGYLFSR